MCYLKVLKSTKTKGLAITLYPMSKPLKQKQIIITDYKLYLQYGFNAFKREHCFRLGCFGGQ
ncbi:MAG: hypothetical protein K0S53_1306 [Bacteroidetes bacterium]|jgi:hypothetical protein|nr:hypothetical protein [Bacteroidota bacterium]MDF2452398.1 hypothetical protein [Bacteroidota bacterium]